MSITPSSANWSPNIPGFLGTASGTTCSEMVRYHGPGAVGRDMRPCALPLGHPSVIPHTASSDGTPIQLPDASKMSLAEILEYLVGLHPNVPEEPLESVSEAILKESEGYYEYGSPVDVSVPDVVDQPQPDAKPAQKATCAPGITKTHAKQALDMGWTKDQLIQIDNLAKVQMVRSLEVTNYVIYLGVGEEATIGVYIDRPISDVTKILAFDPLVRFVAYTDGSGTSSTKPAGLGVVLITQWPSFGLGGKSEPSYLPEFETKMAIGQHCGNGTNNHAELSAIWRALTLVPDLLRPLVIRADSLYAIGCSTNPTWKIKANQDLVARIRNDLAKRPNVTFEHVKGHDGEVNNELADRMANVGRNTPTLAYKQINIRVGKQTEQDVTK